MGGTNGIIASHFDDDLILPALAGWFLYSNFNIFKTIEIFAAILR